MCKIIFFLNQNYILKLWSNIKTCFQKKWNVGISEPNELVSPNEFIRYLRLNYS